MQITFFFVKKFHQFKSLMLALCWYLFMHACVSDGVRGCHLDMRSQSCLDLAHNHARDPAHVGLHMEKRQALGPFLMINDILLTFLFSVPQCC